MSGDGDATDHKAWCRVLLAGDLVKKSHNLAGESGEPTLGYVVSLCSFQSDLRFSVSRCHSSQKI